MKKLMWTVLLAGCGGAEPMMEPEPERPAPATPVMDVPDPLQVRTLNARADCYVPIVNLGTCMGEEAATCQQARDFNRTREAEARALIEPYVLLVEAIEADPTAEFWTVKTHEDEETGELSEITAVPKSRGLETGTFNVYVRFLQDGFLDAEYVQYGLYTPNFTMIDLGGGVLRWTEHAVDLTGGYYRGCDPETEISFDQRMNDEGVFDLYCWDQGGNRVDCGGADLWPL